MTADDGPRDIARRRLVALAGGGRESGDPFVPGPPEPVPVVPAPSEPVPVVPGPPAPGPPGPVPIVPAPSDSSATPVGAASLRARAARSAEVYAELHGHPLDHPAADREPVHRRWATSPRAAAAAAVVLALLCGAIVVHALRQTPVSTEIPAPAVTAGAGARSAAGGEDAAGDPSADPSATSPPGASAVVVVHVVGQVLQPGVVELRAGSRVVDAVAAAGGATSDADLGAINLARVLVDGEQVVVPLPGQVLAAAGPATASTTVPGGPGIDLNAADVAALDTLPGVGPVLAQRIVDWRDAHGRFSDVEELREVSGIGPSLLERVRDQVHV